MNNQEHVPEQGSDDASPANSGEARKSVEKARRPKKDQETAAAGKPGNPTYAGRIRHHAKVHDGQHPAIIEPATWDEVQERLKASAARKRGRSGSGSMTSPLSSKMLDETGDHLTPSHAKKKGRRYRYYVSNRMITGSADTSGWRLPAKALEDQIANAVLDHLRARLPVDLISCPSADAIIRVRDVLEAYASEWSANGPGVILSCIERVTIAPGTVTLVLDHDIVADQFGFEPASINANTLRFSTPFQFRKRGVETKLIIGAAPNKAVDETLIHNIAKAHRYYDAIKQGRTFDYIATSENLTKRWILQVIDLAFLAPEIVKSIVQGDQPIDLTTKWLLRNALPSDWQAQRRIIARL